MQRIKASFAVGLNWPVSIELMVFLDTPTMSAKADCDNPFSVLACFKWFFKIRVSFMLVPHKESDGRKYCGNQSNQCHN